MLKRIATFSCWLLASSLMTGQAIAGPWIDAGDARLRHHIQVLADQGVITAPITTWPLMWASISSDISKARSQQLDEQTFWSLKYVKFAYQQQTRALNISASANLRSDVNPLTSFSNSQRESDSSSAQVDWLGDRFAARISASYSDDPLDGDSLRADDSYLAVTLGNWALSAGAIDRWWGPGWQSSLILSNNARPVPGLALQRSSATAFETPWLSWLGPWQLIAFGGQLESERHVPDAKLVGARFSFKPGAHWEIGLSRSAQWGGEGRPQNWDSFKNLVIGKDNRGGEGIDTSNEPGNQLGGIDIRYNFNWGQFSHATYIQFIGEDEAGGMPSQGMLQLGTETSFIAMDTQHRIVLEAMETTLDSHSDPIYNSAYEHSIYQSGYRYKQRPLGAAADNDTRALALSGQHYFSNGHQLQWSAAYMEINQDRVTRASPGGSVFGTGADTTYITTSYALPLSKHWLAEVGLSFSTETLVYNNEVLDDGGYLALRFKY